MAMQARSDLDIIHKKEKQIFEQSVEEAVKNLEKTHHKVISNVIVHNSFSLPPFLSLSLSLSLQEMEKLDSSSS